MSELKMSIEKDIKEWETSMKQESLDIEKMLHTIKQMKQTIKEKGQKVHTLDGAIQASRKVLITLESVKPEGEVV